MPGFYLNFFFNPSLLSGGLGGHIRGVGFGLASHPDEALLVPANNKDDFVT